MKTIIALAAIGTMSLGLASQAQAASLYKLSPSGNFTAKGATVLNGPGGTLNCTATFGGRVSATGGGSVTSFTAVGDPGCSALVATNLPWVAQAVNATQIAFRHVTVGIPGLFTCGSSSQTTKVTDSAGAVAFNTSLSGNCTTSGTVVTSPTVLIVHR